MLRVGQIVKAKKALAQIASASPPLAPFAASIAVHPTQSPLEFPHISDILAANSSATMKYQSHVTLPAISVNDVPVLVGSLPQSLFYNASHPNATHLHRTLRTIPIHRGLFSNPPSRLRILFTNVLGASFFIKLEINEPIMTNLPPSYFLPEIEAVEDDTDLLQRAILSDTSIWKIRWDCLIMLCVLICAVEIPFQLGFNLSPADVLDNCINYLFIVGS